MTHIFEKEHSISVISDSSLSINKLFSVSSQRRKFLGRAFADTLKLNERTCVREKDGIGTVQSI